MSILASPNTWSLAKGYKRRPTEAKTFKKLMKIITASMKMRRFVAGFEQVAWPVIWSIVGGREVLFDVQEEGINCTTAFVITELELYYPD